MNHEVERQGHDDNDPRNMNLSPQMQGKSTIIDLILNWPFPADTGDKQ